MRIFNEKKQQPKAVGKFLSAQFIATELLTGPGLFPPRPNPRVYLNVMPEQNQYGLEKRIMRVGLYVCMCDCILENMKSQEKFMANE